MCKQNRNILAFTLIELSIVLVIISLVISAITAGNYLVTNAKLRAVIKETQDILTATSAFRDRYFALPGDLDNAQTIFGSTDKNGNAITNGNANGLLDGTVIGTSSTWPEHYSAMQELALAGLIKGTYNGTGTATIGVNIPASSYANNAGYFFIAYNFFGQFQTLNSLVFDTITAGANNLGIAVNDAYYIDNKIDDGLPYTGKVVSYGSAANNCVATYLNGAASPLSGYVYLYNGTTNCQVNFAFPSFSFQ